MNNVRVLELNVSPKFALMKQVVLNVNSTQPTMSASSSKIKKCLLLNCKSLHMNRQKLTSILYRCFLTNLKI